MRLIRRVTGEDAQSFPGFCEKDVFGVRIAACAAAYGITYGFTQFWVQERDGKLTAALSKIDNTMTLTLTELAGREELWAFLNAVKFDSLLCEEAFGRELPAENKEYGFVLEHTGPLPPDRPFAGTLEKSPRLQDVYTVLNGAESGWVSVRHYESWYADVSHRVRHGTAHALLLRSPEGEPAAVAMLTAIGGSAVLMGSVATLPAFRRRGYGSILIGAYLKRLKSQGKRVCLLREDGKNEEFYHTLGFSEQGRWCQIVRKDTP